MSIAVVEKTFQILEAMARSGKAMPLLALSEETALPKPTAYRILQSLAGLGYVAQEEKTGHYFTTWRLSDLVPRDPHLRLKEAARPAMERLHARFNETVNLGVLDGGTVRYIQVLETTKPLRWVVRPGRSDPFHLTALGRAIAAFQSRDRQDRLLEKADGDPKRLRRILDETRRRGWAMEEEEAAAGVACLAMPLAERGVANAAISVSVPVSRLTRKLRDELVTEFLQLQKDARTEPVKVGDSAPLHLAGRR